MGLHDVFNISRRLKLVAFSLLISEFVRSLGFNLYTISLPLMAQSMTSSTVLIGLAVSIYGFVSCTVQLPLGRFSDKHGRRGILLLSAFIYAAGALAIGFSENIYEFIIFRALQASGALMSVLQACLGDIFPAERRGAAMAWFSIVYAVGSIVGLPIGLVVAGFYGLHMPFYVGAILAFAAAAIMVIFLRETHPGKQKVTASEQLTPAAEQETKTASQTPVMASQISTATPVLGLMRIKGFIPSCIVGTVVSAVMGAFFAFAPSWLKSLGLDIFDMAWIFIPGMGIFFVGAFVSGVLSDRMGRKKPVMFGLAFGAPSAFVVIFLSKAPFIVMVPFVMVMMLGVAISQPPLSALVIDLVDKSIRGRATGIYNTLTVLGNASGALIAGVVAMSTLGFYAIFLLAACLMGGGLVIGLILMPNKRKVTVQPNVQESS